jgi:hypothetical protein
MINLKNPEELEIELIKTMGVSVKNEGAIGMFGPALIWMNTNRHVWTGFDMDEYE